MQPLKDEHHELWPRVESLLSTAKAVGGADANSIRFQLDAILAFLQDDLIPHAFAEDRVLYPAVERAMGATGATATMSRDHLEVAHLVDDLDRAHRALPAGQLGDVEATELCRILFSLYALLKLHFAKEEEIYLPLLEDRLSDPEAAKMFSEMEEAANQARRAR
jgi:iron-sulfur cluster repair protein YtfE (RIC family)